MRNEDVLDEPTNWNHAVYMRGKLTDVILVLVTGEGDARSRLRESVPLLRRVVPGMLPSACDIRKRAEWVFAAMTKFHDPVEYASRPSNSPETIYDSTLRRIKNRTGAKIIGELFGVWMDLSALVDEHYKKN